MDFASLIESERCVWFFTIKGVVNMFGSCWVESDKAEDGRRKRLIHRHTLLRRFLHYKPPKTPPPLAPPSPPNPPKKSQTFTHQSSTWHDPYSWMSGLNDRVAMRHMDIYMEQEEKYLEVVMMNTERLQSKLQSEMGSRLQYDLSTPPLMWSPWLYYRRVEEGKSYLVLCRRLLKLNDEFVSNKSPFRRKRRRFVTIPLISTRPIAAVRSTGFSE
ncbi:hypothetical protein ACFE04_014536 [Oxalis oulophora]